MRYANRKINQKILSEIIQNNKANNLKAGSRCSLNTGPHKYLKQALLAAAYHLGPAYITLSSYRFAQLFNLCTNTVLNHGGVFAIKDDWFKNDLIRLTKYKKFTTLQMQIITFYEEIRRDHRTIDIAIWTNDYDFLLKVILPFKSKIDDRHIGDFVFAMVTWLKAWQADDYEAQSKQHWGSLVAVINKYTNVGRISAD